MKHIYNRPNVTLPKPCQVAQPAREVVQSNADKRKPKKKKNAEIKQNCLSSFNMTGIMSIQCRNCKMYHVTRLFFKKICITVLFINDITALQESLTDTESVTDTWEWKKKNLIRYLWYMDYLLFNMNSYITLTFLLTIPQIWPVKNFDWDMGWAAHLGRQQHGCIN